ncbi:MAG: cation transporter [Chromatiales bacterium]|nr:cation transporter [Chromatiales bacterium]
MHVSHAPTPADRAGERYRIVRKVTLVGAVFDLLLGVLKLVTGWVAHSQALIADGFHSLSDLATDVMVIVAARHAGKDADDDHPYGHQRFETLATAALGIALMGVGIGIAWDATDRLFEPERLLEPGGWTLAAAALSVVIKEAIYHYTMHYARTLRSAMLRANAWHSRSDAFSSIAVIIGVAGAMAGLTYLDAVAAVVVAVMIAKIGLDLAWSSVRELVDEGLDEERLERIRHLIEDVDGVRSLHLLRTRRMGGQALVDVHLLVAPRLSVSEGHHIAETARARLIDEIEEVDDVMVHIDPEDDEASDRCDGLPLRGELLRRLEVAWGGVVPEEVTLHYLDGAIDVDVVLKPEAADAGTVAALIRAGEALEIVRTVRVLTGRARTDRRGAAAVSTPAR